MYKLSYVWQKMVSSFWALIIVHAALGTAYLASLHVTHHQVRIDIVQD